MIKQLSIDPAIQGCPPWRLGRRFPVRPGGLLPPHDSNRHSGPVLWNLWSSGDNYLPTACHSHPGRHDRSTPWHQTRTCKDPEPQRYIHLGASRAAEHCAHLSRTSLAFGSAPRAAPPSDRGPCSGDAVQSRPPILLYIRHSDFRRSHPFGPLSRYLAWRLLTTASCRDIDDGSCPCLGCTRKPEIGGPPRRLTLSDDLQSRCSCKHGVNRCIGCRKPLDGNL